MNQQRSPQKYPWARDVRVVLTPSLAALIIMFVLSIDTLLNRYPLDAKELGTLIIGVIGSVFIFTQTRVVTSNPRRIDQFYLWLVAAFSGLGLGVLAITLDEQSQLLWRMLQILATISLAVVSNRWPTYLMVAISATFNFFGRFVNPISFLSITSLLVPTLTSIVVTETLLHLRKATQDQIHRLEMVNKFSQQINSSLETQQVLSLLNAAIEGALVADTYFVGLVEGDKVKLDLFYDDGEYFENVEVTLDGSLSGWVIKNQQPLFLPDLREDERRVIIGKEKSSLSWMGVPMKGIHVNGLLAVASYKAKAFDQADLELLSNLAQHATLALENTFHHAMVEEQSRLDSLTGVYNHGYFLKTLETKIEEALLVKQPLGLIMLDIDHFKRYNDSFGHQVGDQVLTTLCSIIREHIKSTDFVGRWGGEEFVIALPGASGENTYQVARRIQNSLSKVKLDGLDRPIPTPTVSQGISVIPAEASEINRLIYMADKRLYTAKERGRNQIEPDKSYLEKMSSSSDPKIDPA